MSNDQRGAAGSQFPEAPSIISASVSASTEKVALIENEYRNIEQDGAGYSESLLLPFRQCRSLLTDDRIVTLREVMMDSWIRARRAAATISSSVASGRPYVKF